ncbi:MAG: SRPBCC family protein [Chitinophagales bacterium]|nr:SRPBCC family protein [Chitinophagales bacterium]
MKKVAVKRMMQVPAEAAWKVISRITGLEEYHPGIYNSILTNDEVAMRTTVTNNGNTYTETILRLDSRAMELLYDIQDPSPLPYSNFTGFIKIVPVNMISCEIRWAAVFRPGTPNEDEAVQLIEKDIHSCIDGLEKYCRVVQAN